MFAAGVDLKVMSQLVNVNCPHLTVYDLTSAHCTKDMVCCLVSCPYQALTALNLSWGCLDLAGVQKLVKGNWPKLVKLDVQGNDLCSGAVSHLIQCGSWPRLVGLDMSRNPMSVFARIKVGNGQSLSLICLVRSAGTMPAWLQQNWPAIEWIDLSDCQRDDV